MNLRALSRADLDRVVQIHERITKTVVCERWRQMLAEHVDNPDQPGFVAERDGKVLGFIIGEVKVGGFGSEISGWIEMVDVDPEHMGSGIGGTLANHLMEHFAKHGVQDICTSVRWDSGDMLAFFKNLGFDRSPFINLNRKKRIRQD